MSRLFLEDGESIPVTAISVCGNFVADIKTKERNGYNAVVLSKSKKLNNLSKSQSEFFKKNNINPGSLSEFKVENDIDTFEIGKHMTADVFEVGQFVDITGTSKGKGYAGVIKRHNFSRQKKTHGTGHTERAPGSIGQASDPSRVFPGMRMAGRHGNSKVTVENLKVVKVKRESNQIFLKGAVPGAKDGVVVISK